MTNLYMDKKWAPMLPPGVLAWSDSSNNEAYLAGKLAYTQNGGTVYGKAILDKNPIKDITALPPAGGRPGQPRVQQPERQLFCADEGRQEPERGPRDDPAASCSPGGHGRHLGQRARLCAAGLCQPLERVQVHPDQPGGAGPAAKSPRIANGNVVPGLYPGPALQPGAGLGQHGAASWKTRSPTSCAAPRPRTPSRPATTATSRSSRNSSCPARKPKQRCLDKTGVELSAGRLALAEGLTWLTAVLSKASCHGLGLRACTAQAVTRRVKSIAVR